MRCLYQYGFARVPYSENGKHTVLHIPPAADRLDRFAHAVFITGMRVIMRFWKFSGGSIKRLTLGAILLALILIAGRPAAAQDANSAKITAPKAVDSLF